MRKTSLLILVAILAALALSTGCSVSFSTANMSSLKVGKEKPVAHEVTSFGPQDTIYATATISNSPGLVKVKGSFIVEDVPGQKPGPVPSLETTVDLPSGGDANFTFTPGNPWPAGKYKFEAVMMNENGEAKDTKSVSFTIQ